MSGPVYGAGYQAPPPYSAPPNPYAAQPDPYSAPPEPPRRSLWPIALIASVAVLIITVVSIVVVSAVRSGDEGQQPGGGSNAAGNQGPVDKCLVGKWKQVDYQRNVELADTEAGKKANLGMIMMRGSGKQWTINADGSAVEDDSNTLYTGKTPDGRTVTAKFTGKSEWALETRDGKIHSAGKDSTTVVIISVNNVEAGRIQLEPNIDPYPFTCTGDVWRTTSSTDSNGFARFDRVK